VGQAAPAVFIDTRQ